MSLRMTLLATIGAAAAFAASAQAATFNLSSSIGASTPLSITAGGNAATFSSASGPGAFSVASTAGLFSFPVGLGDFASFSGDPLTITFSQPVTDAISFRFGVENAFGAGDILTLAANTGQTQTFGTSLNTLPFAEPEGSVNFVPRTALTSLTLTSANPFAIGDVNVNANVPEPMSITLLGAGLVGLAAMRRRAVGR